MSIVSTVQPDLRRKKINGQKLLVIFLFAVVPLFLLILFTYIPFAKMIQFSFHNMSYTKDKGIVGFDNYLRIFTKSEYVDAMLLSPGCADPLSRRACRVSMGTVFQIPWTRLGSAPADWPEAGMARLRSMGFRTAALALSERSLSIDDPRLAAEPKLALLLGTEGDGLSPETVAVCDYTVRIPMANGVDSLNVAAAGAVAFWQLCRQKLP